MASTVEHSYLEVKLKKFDRVCRPGEKLEGTVTVHAFKGWQHQGLTLVTEGKIYLNSTPKGVGILDAAAANIKPIVIAREEFVLAPPGKFADGPTDVPFEFVLNGLNGQPLIESYHGVYISIIYTVTASIDRGVMKKGLIKEVEYIVEVPVGRTTETPKPTTFDITPETLDNVDRAALAKIPRFKITGKLHRSHCPINLPFTGEVIIESADAPIRSIDLQLVRIESITTDHFALSHEPTEIQTIQIGEGNICRRMVVPMYMVFPRLFACPTVVMPQFKIEFEVNLIVLFGDGYMVTENFPLTLYRES